MPALGDYWSAVAVGELDPTMLNAVTTGTSGAVSFDAPGVLIRACTMVVRGSAGVSAGAVQLQATVDGTNWFNVGTPVTVAASTNTGFYTTLHATAVRATVSTAVVGGTVTVDLAIDGQT